MWFCWGLIPTSGCEKFLKITHKLESKKEIFCKFIAFSKEWDIYRNYSWIIIQGRNLIMKIHSFFSKCGLFKRNIHKLESKKEISSCKFIAFTKVNINYDIQSLKKNHVAKFYVSPQLFCFWGSLHGIVSHVLNSDIIVNESEFQSLNYIHFWERYQLSHPLPAIV